LLTCQACHPAVMPGRKADDGEISFPPGSLCLPGNGIGAFQMSLFLSGPFVLFVVYIFLTACPCVLTCFFSLSYFPVNWQLTLELFLGDIKYYRYSPVVTFFLFLLFYLPVVATILICVDHLGACTCRRIFPLLPCMPSILLWILCIHHIVCMYLCIDM
jgi:hypothetical protein